VAGGAVGVHGLVRAVCAGARPGLDGGPGERQKRLVLLQPRPRPRRRRRHERAAHGRLPHRGGRSSDLPGYRRCAGSSGWTVQARRQRSPGTTCSRAGASPPGSAPAASPPSSHGRRHRCSASRIGRRWRPSSRTGRTGGCTSTPQPPVQVSPSGPHSAGVQHGGLDDRSRAGGCPRAGRISRLAQRARRACGSSANSSGGSRAVASPSMPAGTCAAGASTRKVGLVRWAHPVAVAVLAVAARGEGCAQSVSGSDREGGHLQHVGVQPLPGALPERDAHVVLVVRDEQDQRPVLEPAGCVPERHGPAAVRR
jgi:hypothetical protein